MILSSRHACGQRDLEKQDVCRHPVRLYTAWLGTPQVRSITCLVYFIPWFSIKFNLQSRMGVVNVKKEKKKVQNCYKSSKHTGSKLLVLSLLTFLYSTWYKSAVAVGIHSLMHWLFSVPLDHRVHVSLYVEPGETGFIGKQLMSQEAAVEIESYSNKPDCRIQLLD